MIMILFTQRFSSKHSRNLNKCNFLACWWSASIFKHQVTLQIKCPLGAVLQFISERNTKHNPNLLIQKNRKGRGGGVYVNENLGIANTQIPKSQIRLAVWSEEVADKETEPEWLLLQNNPCAVANRLNSSWQEINPAQKKLLTLHCMLMCVQWLDCSVKRLSLLLHWPQRSITQQRSASTEKRSRA